MYIMLRFAGEVAGTSGCWQRGTCGRRSCWELAIFANRALRRIVASMRVREMRKLVQLRGLRLDPTARRLGACYDIGDLRLAAKRRIPRPVFDYVDGAADEEIASAANVAAFRSWRFLPRVLAGVGAAETAADNETPREGRCARRLQGTSPQPACSAHRGDLSPWFSSARTVSCQSH